MSRFVVTRSLNEALEELAGGARIIAGGTDLMVSLRRDRLSGGDPPATLLDVTGLPELNRLDLSSSTSFVGAAVTFRRLEMDSGAVLEHPVLAQSAATVGSVQIRNQATIGGNVANASPAADGVTALVALGARARIASVAGSRLASLEDLITGPNSTMLRPDELIVGFELDRIPAAGQVFRKMVASGSPGPPLWRDAGAMASEEFVKVCGWRASAAYKVPAAARLVTHALETAWGKVGGA